MDLPKWLPEIIGTCAFFFTITSYQCKQRNHILFLQMLSTACWTMHFVLLGALAGAVLNIVGFTRCIVFSFRGQKWADWVGWIPVYILLSAAAVALTWNGWVCLLPWMGMVLTTFAQRGKTAAMVRAITLPNDPLWLLYNALNGSISGVITEICIICSICLGMIRHDIPEWRQRRKQQGE